MSPVSPFPWEETVNNKSSSTETLLRGERWSISPQHSDQAYWWPLDRPTIGSRKAPVSAEIIHFDSINNSIHYGHPQCSVELKLSSLYRFTFVRQNRSKRKLFKLQQSISLYLWNWFIIVSLYGPNMPALFLFSSIKVLNRRIFFLTLSGG